MTHETDDPDDDLAADTTLVTMGDLDYALTKIVGPMIAELRRRTEVLESKQKASGSSDELATLRTRVAGLEGKTRKIPDASDLARRFEELEARPSFQYRGVYSSAVHYKKGDFVTFQGALWHCSDLAFGIQPGDGVHWKMAVKSGRDGKDTK